MWASLATSKAGWKTRCLDAVRLHPCSGAFSMPLARSMGCSASGPSRRSGGRPSAGAGQQRTRSTSPGEQAPRGFPAGPVRVVARDVELKHVRRELLFRWTIIVLAGSARRGSRINNRDRERSRRNGGTTSAESRVGHAATCSVAGRVRPAVHPGPEHAAARGVLRARRTASLLVCLEQHGRPPAPGGPPALSPSPRARVVLPTRCAPRGAKPAGPSPPVTPTPTGSGPARAIPESGGPPRPVSVVDGRDAPSRPGRKAHNCHPSRGACGVSPEGP